VNVRSWAEYGRWRAKTPPAGPTNRTYPIWSTWRKSLSLTPNSKPPPFPYSRRELSFSLCGTQKQDR
jgi:hypothetical protein